ncbi:MAG: hypothetical protein GY943_29215 [Chloroflexi bacterium]|nr:hypothetical protein [Chloroflexota bacterium]
MRHPVKTYMICATPRSGSTLLCEALRNTGLAGNPDEYFGPMHVSRWSQMWQTRSETDYLEKMITTGQGDNGVLGMKVMRLYWQNFTKFLTKAINAPVDSNAELLNACFPGLRYIWITRRDKVRQAVSWLKFTQGVAWYWEDETAQKLAGLEFRPDEISQFIMQTAVHETAWQLFFQEMGIRPYIVTYEDFVDTYEATTKEILDYLEITYREPLRFGQRRLKKQADALSEEWVQTYLAMHKDAEKM